MKRCSAAATHQIAAAIVADGGIPRLTRQEARILEDIFDIASTVARKPALAL